MKEGFAGYRAVHVVGNVHRLERMRRLEAPGSLVEFQQEIVAMPWVEDISDPQELRRCVRDLVALSTLPAIWKTYTSRQIAESVAAKLVAMLRADFVHVALPSIRDQKSIEVTRSGKSMTANARREIRAAIHSHTQALAREQLVTIADPGTPRELLVASAPIGLGGEAILAVGSRRTEFPTKAQRLLVDTAANQITIALQRWHSEAEERRFAALIESSSDFIGFAGLDGSPQYINPAGLNFSGLRTIDEASRLHVLDFLAPEEQAHARDRIYPVVMRSGRWIGELNLRNLETGELVPFLVDCFRIDDPRTGQPMNFGMVSSNLCAQKKSQAQLQQLNGSLERRVSERIAELRSVNNKLTAEIADRARADARVRELQLELFHAARLSTAGQLAAALAHELNQPLTATINSINASRRLITRSGMGADATIVTLLGEASQQALCAGHIMRRLGDFVRRGITDRQAESVAKIVEDAGRLALIGPDAFGVKVLFRFDPKVDQVFADRIQIEQVLVNLMRNALEAMVGRARRELGVSATLLGEQTVEISVTDSGPGLSAEVSDRLFEPFVSTKSDGMGLGLSICRSVVEAHGGRLEVEANPEGGAIFRFTLATAPAEGVRYAG
jgi:PAS domain S-box-containing protein